MTSLHEPLWSQRREPFPSGSERLSLGRPAWRPHPPSNWAAPHDTGERDRETSFFHCSELSGIIRHQSSACICTHIPLCYCISIQWNVFFYYYLFWGRDTQQQKNLQWFKGTFMFTNSFMVTEKGNPICVARWWCL